MTLSEAIEVYIRVWGVSKTYGTKRRVKYQLLAFERFMKLQSITNVYSINISVLTLWIEALKKKGCTALTIYYTVQVVRHFFERLHSEECIDVKPIPDYFYHIRPYIPLRKVPSVEQVLESFESAGKSEAHPIRNRAILELAYSTGLRRMELLSLNCSCVKKDEIRVVGKRGRERIVPFGHEAKKWVYCYLETERVHVVTETGSDEKALFLTEQGNRISENGLHTIVRKQSKQEYSLHAFRHACATHMLKNGASSRVLQKLLGHGRLSTTQIYTSVDVSDIHEMLQKHHPRSKKNVEKTSVTA